MTGRLLKFFGFFLIAISLAEIVSAAEVFPRPAELEPDIRFWTRVYTEIDTSAGFVHDSRRLDVVYEVTRFSPSATSRQRNRQVSAAKARYKDILLTLATGKRNGLSVDEQRVLRLWPAQTSNQSFRVAAQRLRFQLGQSDKFRAGLIRAGAWESYIRQSLMDMGLPVELAVLPHVESSFNPAAKSHVGAAGLWQFTRSTGRRFMRIDHVVDERLDPYMSSVAACRLLEHNYNVTGSWPLALTAYNHGVAGMRRAVNKLGTDDIATIVRRYDGRTFGFASRNFYVAFVAALDVSTDADKYFGVLQRNSEEITEVVSLPEFMSVPTVREAYGLDTATLKRLNPSLMPSVWNGNKYVPRSFELRVPGADDNGDPVSILASVPASERFAVQKPDVYHRVGRGDTLSQIADRYGVSTRQLVELNGLRSRHRIRAGQVLRLPVTDTIAAMPADGRYVVRRGDSVARIAGRYGMSETDLLAMNDIRNKDIIHVGQVLRVAAEPATEPSYIPPATAVAASIPPASTPMQRGRPATETELTEITMEEILVVESAEPTTVQEAEILGPAVLVSAQSDLMADPSDYSVASDGTIEIQAVETLGHYAEWLDLRAQRLRQINTMRYGKPVVIGDRLKLEYTRVSPELFEQRRRAYHRTLQAEFFMQYRIVGTSTHHVRRGDSVWVLTQRQYKVPVWLLRQYNPDLDLNIVRPGVEVVFPRLARRDEAGDSADTTGS